MYTVNVDVPLDSVLVQVAVRWEKSNLSSEKQSQIMSRCEYKPLRDAMLAAIPQARALRGGVPLRRSGRTLPKWKRPRVKRTKPRG